NRYGVFPYVIGRHRMFPPLTASGYSETVGRDIYYRGRMTFGWAPGGVALEDLRIGTTPITEFSGVELEFRNVDKARTLAAMPGLEALVSPKTEESHAPQALLSEVGEQYVYAPSAAAKSVSLTLEPTALYYLSGLTAVVEVEEAGSGTWTAVATYDDLASAQTFSAGPFADGISRSWRVRLTAVTEADVAPKVSRRRSNEGLTVTSASASYQQAEAGWRSGSETMRLYPRDVAEDVYSDVPQQDVPVVKYTRIDTSSAAIDLSFPQGLYKTRSSGKVSGHGTDFQFEYQSTEGGLNEADWIDLGLDNIHAKSTTLFRWTKTITFPEPGEYAIRITRRWLIDEDPGDVNTATLSAIRSFRDGELPSPKGIAEVAFRIMATDQLNGRVDSLNAIVQQLAPVWTGSGWTAPQPVRHPAWGFLQAIRGQHLRRPVRDERIDLEAFRAWATEEPHWTCDYVVDTATQLGEVLDIIAAAGRAKRTLTDLKWSIIRDNAAGPVRQVFTPRNSWGFKAEHRFPRKIHGFRVKARSERLEWQEDEILVLADGFTRKTASELETLDLPGVVVTTEDEDEGNVYRLGRYHLATALNRPATYTLQVGWEHLRVTRGDKVRFVHDVPLIGVGQARIKAITLGGDGFVDSLTLDDVFDFDQASFRMLVRNVGGNQSFTAFSPVDPQTRVWTPATNVAAGDIAVGDLVIVEELMQESVDLIVTSVRPKPDESAELQLVDAVPAVLDADNGAIPPYSPVITEPRDPATAGLPPAPVVISAYSSSLTQIVLPDLSVRPRIAVQLAPFVTGSAAEGVSLQLRWSDAEAEAAWVYGEKVAAGEYTLLTGALEEGESYRVEVSAVGADGKTRGWVSAGMVTATMAPPAPPLISASAAAFEIPDAAGRGRRPGILLSWVVPPNKSLRVTWQLRIAATGALVQRGLFAEASEGSVLISDGLVPNVAYQVRASFVTGASDQRSWTSWMDVTTDDVRLARDDLDTALTDQLDEASTVANQALQDAEDAHQAADAVSDELHAAVASLTVDYDAAQKAAQDAQTARDAAVLAKESAAASKAAAALSETNAGSAADAASSSASAAESSATEAGQQASAATAAKNAAATSESNASTFAQSAAAAKQDAEGAAAAAASSEELVASTAGLYVHPSDFALDGKFWSDAIAGDPKAKPDKVDAFRDTPDGRVIYRSLPLASNSHLVPKFYLRNAPGKTFRMTLRARYVGALGDQTNAALRLQFRRINGDFSSTTATWTKDCIFAAANTVETFSYEITDQNGLTPWMLGFAYWPSAYTGTGDVEVLSFEVEDVTAQKQAQDAAEAAASHAQSAAASESGASQAASAANESKGEAATSAGQASTYAGQAATAKADAEGAANSASEFSRLASITQRAASTRNLVVQPDVNDVPVGAQPEFWNNRATVVDGRPGGVPETDRSLDLADGAATAPWYVGNPVGRKYRFKATVRTIDTGAVSRFTLRGEDEAGNPLQTVGSFNFPAGQPWAVFEDVIEVTQTSYVRFAPGFDLTDGGTIRVYDFQCHDVTEEENASEAAMAANTSAENASTSKDQAGSFAGAASTHAQSAQTQAGYALNHAEAAALSKNAAKGSAVAAATYSQTAARITGQGVGCLADAYFDTYGDPYGEAGSMWLDFDGGPDSQPPAANQIFPVGKSLSFNYTDLTAHSGVRMQTSVGWKGPQNEAAYVVEVIFTYVGGAGIGGAGILLDWNHSSGESRAAIKLEDMIAGGLKAGVPTFASAILKRPASFPGNFTTHDAWLMANYDGNGLGPIQRKHIRFHYFQIRAATPQDLQNLDTAATVAQDTQTLATLDGKVRASTGITAAVTSAGNTEVAELRLTSYDDPDGSSGSAVVLKGDDVIADGTLTTRKLAVGFAGNQLTNTAFWAGLNDWSNNAGGGVGAQSSFLVRSPGSSYAGLRYPTLYIYQAGTATDGYADFVSTPSYTADGGNGLGAACRANQKWEASVYVSTHRCVGQLRIQWVDASGNTITYSGPVTIPTNSGSADNPDEWQRIGVRGIAPTGAAYARIHIRKLGTQSSTSSYLFFHKPMLCECPVNATELTPYGPGGATFIDGDIIRTASVYGDRMVARSMEADVLKARSLTAAEVAVGTLSAEEIIADGITRQGVAGSGLVTNDSATWTTVAAFTLPSMPKPSYVQGIVSFDLTTIPTGIPGQNWNLRVVVQGSVRLLLNFTSAGFYTSAQRYHIRAFTLQGAAAGNVEVKFEINHFGGAGIQNCNLSAIAAMR
ncbi:hypothetical protein G0Q01_11860, partial [Yangia sp. PrR007]|nr:hypothetical protein [Salipiger sp. PrR007]